MTEESMLERTARLIDEGASGLDPITGIVKMAPEPAAEVADGVVVVEGFSNSISFDTGDGLVTFDASHELVAPAMVEHLRAWSTAPIDTLIYTHGHVDHVTGAAAFDADAEHRGHPPILYVAHEAVPERFERYQRTGGYNGYINMRQFRLPGPMFPSEFRFPDETYEHTHTIEQGGMTFELHHARGETDDHTWAWIPEHRAIAIGDLFIWQFPNAGNPQKVQRYAWDWAVALRSMLELEPELLLPAHGPAIGGTERIALVLGDTAQALEYLHTEVLAMMNAGARLDEVLTTVRLPDDLAKKPWLSPTYDEPEFVIRNIWRLYGGWWDGNPATLKPARDARLAVELADAAGGADRLVARALRLVEDDELALACHLVELAALAEPDSVPVHAARAEVYRARQHAEISFMATGIYRSAALDSERAMGSSDA